MIRLAVGLATAMVYIAVRVAERAWWKRQSPPAVFPDGLVIVIVVLVVVGGVWGLLWWLNRWLDRRR